MNATERGVNPYRPGGIGAYDNSVAPADPYDPRAVGLNGDTLDAMMKARWQEGHTAGKYDGVAAAKRAYPDIYDEAYAAGHGAGTQEEGARLLRDFLPALQRFGGVLVTVTEKTGSEEIKNLCNEEVARIRELLATHVGAYAEQSAATAGTGQPG